MRSRFPKYSDYAAINIESFFNEEDLKDALVITYQNFETSYLKNYKGKNLSLNPLPVEAQFSPVFGVLIEDFDDDLYPDILITGNSFAPSITLGWNDASIGVVLKGLGNGQFTALKTEVSGIYAD